MERVAGSLVVTVLGEAPRVVVKMVRPVRIGDFGAEDGKEYPFRDWCVL